MFYVNDDAPPGIRIKPAPENAAIGQIREGSTMEDVGGYLADQGVPSDRIHFLVGEEGEAFLQDIGNWWSKVLADGWTRSREALADGRVLVGVFDVDRVDADLMRGILSDAGVENVKYFGKWTIS